ncbi:hypothetical protein SELR_pSRC102040 (plasmid) [Selenomonas ruminantium subsp. lactilytica TAM6421]|uniref:Uncharacterized protein n=1 Tax=Selenomonas ruminantium subsp. lactilytica (strain NBRC 103574 / TAM6421) TaxID=927704 RepID=I0GW74_SELRL|nr:hypothetical protein [Selenomonas ruminantium]BAL85011.1 hypothetical protein SELR_pSRC102040 [Selenomonas ruminantium subsp. lactilytica TAM6421]
MRTYEYGNIQADIVLVQPVGDHDLAGIEAEVAEIQRLTNKGFRLLAVKVEDWNRNLSPWQDPAVFGNDDFGDGAKKTLAGILNLCQEKARNPVMGKVGDCIRDAYGWLNERGISCILEWNKGGHFKEPELRMARAFAWLLRGHQEN